MYIFLLLPSNNVKVAFTHAQQGHTITENVYAGCDNFRNILYTLLVNIESTSIDDTHSIS